MILMVCVWTQRWENEFDKCLGLMNVYSAGWFSFTYPGHKCFLRIFVVNRKILLFRQLTAILLLFFHMTADVFPAFLKDRQIYKKNIPKVLHCLHILLPLQSYLCVFYLRLRQGFFLEAMKQTQIWVINSLILLCLVYFVYTILWNQVPYIWWFKWRTIDTSHMAKASSTLQHIM